MKENINYLNTQGMKYYRQRRYTEALECIEKALKIDSNSVLSLQNKGLILDAQGQYKEAMKCYEKVLKLNSEVKSGD